MNKYFLKSDLKPGMAVEMRDGRYCLVVPFIEDIAFVQLLADNNLHRIIETKYLSGILTYPNKHYDIMKVYGFPKKGYTYFGSHDGRELLWERPYEPWADGN